MRMIFVAVILLLAGCASGKNDIRYTSASDPIWPVNPSKWAGPSVQR